jgi:plasmid maintenance system killer protein
MLCSVAIQRFASQALERFFLEGRLPKGVGWSAVAKIATRKLDMLDYAAALRDLASPPGNRLEALRGNSMGFTAFESTISGGCSFAGRRPDPPRSISATTTEDWP